MDTIKGKKILVSGASMAGLSTAYWMNKLGYEVTVVELASAPRVNGAAVDFRGNTIDIIKRMGIYDQLKANSLQVEMIEFKNVDDVTEGSIVLNNSEEENGEDEIEIERDKFVDILMDSLKNEVTFIFNDSITALQETKDEIKVEFKNSLPETFDLVFGCDGLHSVVRKLAFGHETEYSHFLNAYFSITILNKLLVKPNTMQMYNEPDRAITLNAYNGKTDVIFCFVADEEIPYDYRDVDQQKKMILEKFAGQGWKTPALLDEVLASEAFYFDKFCQIKMPSWTKSRVALIGDAAYCASPAAGMGGSLALMGAATLADAIEAHNGNFELAFAEYNRKLRPLIEEVQATAATNLKENFIPRTQAAIHQRNTQTAQF